jgi:hypothetical protein
MFNKLFNWINNQEEFSSETVYNRVTHLCDRAKSCMLIDDRRKSIQMLNDLLKEHKQEVGTQALPVLIEVIRQNK